MATTYIPILEYHDLSAEPWDKSSFHSPYVLDPQKFYDQLKWLQKNSFQAISIDDLFSDRIIEKSVILTFDDGHISNYECALPLLQEFDFQATFFLIAQFIGEKNYLNIEHIQEMQAAGMHFESHSLTHPYLLTLGRKAMTREISESRLVIEKIVKKNINHFCIPYGFYNKDLIQCVKNVGYKSVLTEKMGYYSHDCRPFKVLPRFTMKAKMKQNEFVHIMTQQRNKMVSQYLIENVLYLAKKVLGFKGYMRIKSLIAKSYMKRIGKRF